jgi:hypothetical protein
MSDGNFTLTEKVTGVFLNLIEPKVVGKKGKDKKYSGSFLLSPDSQDLPELKSAMVAVARAKWPERELSELKFPIEDGDKAYARTTAEGKNYPFLQGHVVLTARKPEKYPPRLAILENGAVKELEGDARALAAPKFYWGCKVVIEVQFNAYEGVGQLPDGVNAYLNQVLWISDGDRLGGTSMAQTFQGFVGQVKQEDPTAGSTDTGLDDEIPF